MRTYSHLAWSPEGPSRRWRFCKVCGGSPSLSFKCLKSRNITACVRDIKLLNNSRFDSSCRISGFGRLSLWPSISSFDTFHISVRSLVPLESTMPYRRQISKCNTRHSLELTYLTQSFVSVVRAGSVVFIVIFLLLLDRQSIKNPRPQFMHLRGIFYKFFTIDRPLLSNTNLDLMSAVPFSLFNGTT